MGCCKKCKCGHKKSFEDKCCHISPCCCGRTEYASLHTKKVRGISDFNRVFDERTTSPCCCCKHW